MISRFRGRVSSAHLIALLALFVALGSGAYAANKVGTKQIKNKAVTTQKLKGAAVTTGKIANGAVVESKLHNNAVTSFKLANGAVTAEKLAEYTNSGLVKLSIGETKVLLTKGPFTFTAKCEDGGAGVVNASMTVKNTGGTAGLFESDYESNYNDPVLDPGEELNAFYSVSQSVPYWFGEYYNLFSATSDDGSTSITGSGNIGVKVLGTDCVYQLFTQGT